MSLLLFLGLGLGLVAGVVGSIVPQISGLLMSLSLPLGMLDWSTSVGFIIAYRGVVGVTQYLDSLSINLNSNRITRTEKGDQLKISLGAANQYLQIKLLTSIIASVFVLVLNSGNLLPSVSVILPVSVAFTGLMWMQYIVKKKEQAPFYLAILISIAILATFTVKSGMVQSTMVLLFGLYSLKGLLYQIQGAIPPQKDGVMPCKSMNWALSIVNAVLSCVAIGFTSLKVYKSRDDSRNEVRITYERAITDAIADVLGLCLFFLQGSSRDMTTTFIGLALNTSKGLVTLPLGAFIPLGIMSVVISMFALSSFQWIAEYKIALHNSSLRPHLNTIGIAINVLGLTLVTGSFYGVIAVLGVGVIINLLMQKWNIKAEFLNVILFVLPALALFGAI